jgi:hypothetical protein
VLTLFIYSVDQINSESGCSLNGVDGSFIVSNANGDATLQINKLYPGSESMAISRHGKINTLLDPEVRLICFFLSVVLKTQVA